VALEYYDDNQASQSSMNQLPEKQCQLENKLAVVESKLHEIKEELTNQLSKCCEMLSAPEVSHAKTSSGPALIANTVFIAINEERDRKKRQLNLIVHNLAVSTSDRGETHKCEDIKRSTDIFNDYLKAKATVTKAIRLGKKANKPRLLKVTVETVETKAFILRNCTNLRKADPSVFSVKFI